MTVENALWAILGGFLVYLVMQWRLGRVKRDREWFAQRLAEVRDMAAERLAMLQEAGVTDEEWDQEDVN